MKAITECDHNRIHPIIVTPQTPPRQLEMSQTSSHFRKQNGQTDTKGNMRGGERERKKRGRGQAGRVEGKVCRTRDRGGGKEKGWEWDIDEMQIEKLE